MKTRNNPLIRAALSLTALLGLLILGSGCEHSVPVQENPDAQIAASLAASSQTAAAVDENLDLAEIFANPMGESIEDLGLDEDPDDFDPWTGGGVNFPEFARIGADAFRGTKDLNLNMAALPQSKDRALEKLNIALAGGDRADAFEGEPGDTIAAYYYNGPDTLGVDALIMVEPPSLVRWISLQTYPNGVYDPEHPFVNKVRQDSEIVLDTMGTDEDGSDDQFYSLFFEKEWANGEIDTGTMAPQSGEGPMQAGELVEATHRVDNPMFHPLQDWVESVVVLDPGEIPVEEDEVLYSMQHTVHWLSDAEHTALIRAEDEGPLEDGSTVEVSASFTAAPGNPWLESIADAMLADMGVLDDEGDDLLLFVSRDMVFDGTAMDGGNPRSHIEFTPEEPVAPGEEPCGGEAHEVVYYPENWWLLYLERDAEIGCDGSGTLRVYMEFLDGSTYERIITWYPDGTADLTETRADGTVVAGSWNENTGEYDVTTTFPAGNDPVSREQSGQVQEGYVTARDETIWQDGHDDVTEFTATETENGYTVDGTKVDGDVEETFHLESQEDESREGSWSRSVGGSEVASGSFALEALEGGGSHLTFNAMNLEEEGEPSIVGEMWFAPDGSGHGTIEVTQFGKTVTYTLEWGPDGEGYLTDTEGNTFPMS